MMGKLGYRMEDRQDGVLMAAGPDYKATFLSVLTFKENDPQRSIWVVLVSLYRAHISVGRIGRKDFKAGLWFVDLITSMLYI
jgi:hypothetical protein